MYSLRVMSIIGIIMFILGFICMAAWGGTVDNDAALGWGFIISGYGIALSIVGVVQTNNLKKKR